jgi:hypothetical protein
MIAMLRPDKSTIIFEDEFGGEVFYARYLNEHAFRIRGTTWMHGQYVHLDNPAAPRASFSDTCLEGASSLP